MPLLDAMVGAIAGCWVPLLDAGCLGKVPLLGGMWWGAIGGGGCTLWRIGRGAVGGCHCWVRLLGCHCWAGIAGCHCWVALPLLAAIARWHVARCHGKVPLLGGMW